MSKSGAITLAFAIAVFASSDFVRSFLNSGSFADAATAAFFALLALGMFGWRISQRRQY